VADGPVVLSVLDFEPRRMGSFEEYFRALGQRLRAEGGRCVAAFSGPPAPDVAEAFRANHVACRELPFRGGSRALRRALRTLVRDVRPDVTHFHFVPLNSPLFRAARRAEAGRIFASHHYSFPLEAPRQPLPLRWPGRLRRAFALAPCAGLVTPSGYIKDCLVSRLALPEGRIRVIHNGVNLARFDPDRKPSGSVRAELGIPPDAPVVSTLAYFRPEKGGDDLVRAVPAVLERVPEMHLLLIGDGSELPRLRGLASELGVADHVHFPGLASGSRLDDLLAETHVATLACTWGEAFSLVVLEFMACGKPIVATAVGGTPEAVVDGRCGLLVPPHAPDRIAEALVTLLSDSALADRMGRAARRRAEDRFSVERMVDDTLALYREAGPQPTRA